MQARYARNFPAITPAEQELLRKAKVCIVGCGGLGGHLVEYLARIGVGHIVAVDGDVFEESNLNRQLLSRMPLLGTSKAEAARIHVEQINPEVRVTAVPSFLTEENADVLIHGCDAVLDALDNIPSRKLLARACGKAGIPCIYGAVRGWVAQAAIAMPGDGLLELLYPEGAEVRDKSVLSFTPALCASLQAALCVKLLIGREVQTGTLFYFDLMHQEFETIPLR